MFVVISFVMRAQVSAGFTDDFSDGNFTENPVWTGNVEKFIVNSEMLQLNDTEAGNASVSTVSQAIDDATWEFFVQYDFNPSTSNHSDVYLASDNSIISECSAGYFVKVCGASTTDNICLYKKNGTTSTKIIDGTALTLNDNSNTFKIKVTRSAEGVWTLFSDVNGVGTYTTEGEVTDMSVTSSAYFGVFCKYSSTRADKFYFDDFSVSGTYFVDTEAPQLQSARFIQNNQILLQFDEDILASSILPENFSVNNEIGQAVSAGFYNEDAQKIVLEFGNIFQNGTEYTLTYSGISDNNGNTISTSETNLQFVEAGSGTIVINEIMADPSPSAGLPECEYLELYNNSQETINFEGWTLKINNTAKTLDTYTLYPAEYVVLCRQGNDTLFTDITNILPVSGLSATALTNTGATITLFNEFMSEVDKITYSSAWYKNASKKDGGWSLERIDPNNKCEQSLNWRASENPNGGTPGIQNSIFGENTDVTAPTVTDISIASANELHITFSETPDTATIRNLENYFLDNDYGNPIYAELSATNSAVVILMFAVSFEQNRIYNLTIRNIADLCGNIMTEQTFQFTTIPIDFNSVVVSEIMSKPAPVAGLPEAKYIEIYNRSDNAISLSDWTITIGSSTKTFPSAIINAQSYLLLTNSENVYLFENISNIAGIDELPSFAQDGATISLSDKNGNIVHSVTFSSSWHDDNFKKNGGYSLEMVDLNNPCGGAENWRSTLNRDGGTPGIQNSVFDTNPDIILPFPTDAEIVNDTVIVYFSEIVNPEFVTVENFSVEEFGNPVFVEIVKPQLTVVKMKFDAQFQIGKIYMLNIGENITDCSGNAVETNMQIRFGIGEELEFNDLVINEILFNPYSGGSDFVEFYNRSEKVLDLKDLWISNTDENGAVKDSYQVTNISRLMLPAEYCAISLDIENLYNHYNIVSPESLYKVAKMPGYSDDFGTVIITTRLFDTIDIVSYDKNQHYKLLSSKDGVSLERINYNSPSDDEANWHSASQDAGFATPGYVNSQFSEIVGGEAQITLSSEVISPDNDGFEDQLNILYNLDVAGYTGTIAVYSSNGQFVKTLLNNRSLNTAGTIVWDGLNENDKACPAGIYIVYVELFNLEGKKIVEKHVVAVNTKLE